MAKQWAWSFSKLNNYETCAYRHQQVDLLKNFQDGDGEALVWGNQVHDAMKQALTGTAPLPASMEYYQRWVDLVRAGPGELLVEQKYAIAKDFTKTAYFAPNVWYRGIADVVRIHGDIALALDWKTGRVKENSVQLALMAQCIFAHYPAVHHVRSEFIWLQEDCTTPEIYSRSDMANLWIALLPRVEKMETAALTKQYPPKPGGLCVKYCPVKSCQFWGKGDR